MSDGGGRRTSQVAELRDSLRRRILAGEFAPGETLSSAALGELFGVSRTPLREALRLLQQEGLVTMADNQRPRVALSSPLDLDVVYAQRILVSALCTSLTVGGLDDERIATMAAASDRMTTAHAAGDISTWHEADSVFHQTHLGAAPEALLGELRHLRRRCRYFFTIWAGFRPNQQPETVEDHRAILEACRGRDAPAAAAAMGRHLHRIGSTLFASISPDDDPVAMQAALALVTDSE